jgi:hypothetical protein
MSIVSVVVSLGGKRTGDGKEYVMDCWFCDGQQKVYFNVKKGIGYCVKCQKTIDLASLFKEAGLSFGASKEALKEIQQEARSVELGDNSLLDCVVSKLLPNRKMEAIRDLPAAKLPDCYFTLEEAEGTSLGKAPLNYLLNRGFKKQLLYELQFGFCVDGFYGGRIIVPFWENNKIVYWQARDYTGKQELKIRNPFENHCQVGKSEVLFNYDGVRDAEVVVICESWGSALATGRMAVGLNGKSASPTQISKLLALKANTFYILLDNGAEKEAEKLAKTLSEFRSVLVAELPWGDPNEVPKQLLNKVVAEAKPYSSMTALHLMATSLSARLHRKV